MRFCDYCGDELDNNREAVAVGHTEGYLRDCRADEWFYYCEGDCTDAVKRVLTDMARSANLEDGSGYVWRLEALPRTKAAPDTAAKAASTKPVNGTATLDGIELHHGSASALRRAGIRTLEEATEFSEVELLGLERVGTGTVRAVIRGLEAKGLALRVGPSPEELGQRIRGLRETAGLTRPELAREVEPKPDKWDNYAVHEKVVCDWEAGRRVPTAEQLERLAACFQVPGAQLTHVAAG